MNLRRDWHAEARLATTGDDLFMALAGSLDKEEVLCEPILADWVARNQVPTPTSADASARLAGVINRDRK